MRALKAELKELNSNKIRSTPKSSRYVNLKNTNVIVKEVSIKQAVEDGDE